MDYVKNGYRAQYAFHESSCTGSEGGATLLFDRSRVDSHFRCFMHGATLYEREMILSLNSKL